MEGNVKLLIWRECIRVLRWGADGTQHSWCTSVHSELKSIGPISICAEYISFVLPFSPAQMEPHLWRHRFSLEGATQCALRFCVDAEPCKLIFLPSFIYFILFFFTCVVAESLPLFSPPVQPGAEAHEDDPAGPSQTCDEGRLLHHVWDAVVTLRSCHYVPQFCTWGPPWTYMGTRHRFKKQKGNRMVRLVWLHEHDQTALQE